MLYVPQEELEGAMFRNCDELNQCGMEKELNELNKRLFNLPAPKKPSQFPLRVCGTTSFVE